MSLQSRWQQQPQKQNHQNLATMYQKILETVTSNEQELLQFLEYSSQIYKYDMESALFAYGQAPNATYLASYDTWKKVGRQVTKGSKAIKILKQKADGQFYHDNLFDVGQTTGRNLIFPDWLLSSEEFKQQTGASFNQEASSYIDSLWLGIESQYEDVSTLNEDILDSSRECSDFMLRHKLGQSPRWKDYLESVTPFVHNPDAFIAAFPIIQQKNVALLNTIQHTKKQLKEQKNDRQLEETSSLSSPTTEKQPGVSKADRTNTGSELSNRPGGADVSRNTRDNRQSDTNQQRADDSNVSHDKQTKSVSRADSHQQSHDLSERPKPGNEEPGTEVVPPVHEGVSRDITNGSDGADEESQSVQRTSPRNHTEGISSDTVKSDPISFKEVFAVLKTGSSYIDNSAKVPTDKLVGVEGKFRITQAFKQKKSKKEIEVLLKDLYGTSGASSVSTYSLMVMADSTGLRITRHGDPTRAPEKKLTWSEVADTIQQMINSEVYLSELEEKSFHSFQRGELAKEQGMSSQDYLVKLLKENVLINVKYDTYNFFNEETDLKKRTDFLEERYGVGGVHSPQEPFNWRSETKGILLNNYYENAMYSWETVAETIQQLINENTYMNEADYEKEEKTTPVTSEKSLEEESPNNEDVEAAIDLTDWTLLSDDYRYQTINERNYLINHDGAYDTKAVDILTHEGKTYYKAAKIKEQAPTATEEATEELNLFDFSFVGEEDVPKKPLTPLHSSKEVNETPSELHDFVFPEDTDSFYSQTPKGKLADNLSALRLLKELDKDSRLATPEEQVILAKYVGWGGLSGVFDESKDNYSEERQELKTLITPQEYESARESVLTAYYTDPMIIQQIYDTLNKMNFTSGKILDPAMGTGNFFGAMPKEMKEKSELYGVELDTLSARISKQLQQSVSIQEKGFQETQFIEDSFDVVVSNVPFADFKIRDNKTLDSYYIHDYFIKRSLDLVHEGGIVAVITSAGTLDKKDQQFRKELANRAALLGAVRLPDNAFKQIAGTEVTTDIIFFQKLSPEVAAEQVNTGWVNTVEIINPQRDEEGRSLPPIVMNQHFANKRSAVLGHFKYKNFRGGTYTVTEKQGAVLEEELSAVLSDIEGSFISSENVPYVAPDVLPIAPTVDVITSDAPPYSYFEEKGVIYFNGSQGAEKQTLGETRFKRMSGMIQIRDILSDVIAYQQELDFEPGLFEDKLRKLNQTYDTFVKQYSYLNTPTNSRLFYDDDRFALLTSIELSQKDGSFKKSAVFFEPTIRPVIPVTKVATGIEALNHSLTKYGKINFDYMESIYPVSREVLLEELDNHIFIDVERYLQEDKHAENAYVTKDEYLSGDVKHKLSLANLMAATEPTFEKNISALTPIIPKDLTIQEIAYDIGASWLPLDTYHEFMQEVFGTNPVEVGSSIKVEYNKFTDTYHIEGKNKDHSVTIRNEYGTSRANAYFLLEKSLNFKTIQIYDQKETWENGEKVTESILNVPETMLARSKQDHLHNTFKDWLFSDPQRAESLLKLYNDRFNRIRPRNYDGSYLSFEGMNGQFELRSPQKNVVARIVENGRALMAHEVGAGKTASMISAGMMMKDQGLIKKPMYVVPNHLTEQFGQELLRFYPSKKVLITGKKDFEKKNRQKFISRIATGDYDAVIIGHSQFEKIPLSKERRIALVSKELRELQEGILLEKQQTGQSWSLKQMVSFEKRMKEKLKNLQNEDYKDRLLTFEELGVDFLFVDEAHTYKNLYTYTKMSNVAGVNTSNSLRASDMYMKTQYMLEKNQGRGVVFATGTPISNSMSELYTMERYLQPDELARMNLHTFDRWASTFGEVINAPEINPEGSGFRMKSRFAKFHNLPELMSSFHLVADIQTSDMLNLPVPKIANGKPELIVSEASDYQTEKMQELAERSDAVRLREVDPREDNMLKITNEAKLMAIDPRLLDETAPVHTEGKLFKCGEKAYDIWQSSADEQATQLIFSDSGTPNPHKFNVYDEMKRILMEKGIPEEEIAFIHSAKNDKQREDLFEKVRQGDVRILLGSTEKLGTGTNIQDKLLAVHHLDVPWRPSDLTQRDGRIVRQGNTHEEVQIFRYVARNSFDSYLWQTQENKLKFINQVMTGKSIARSADDIDQDALNAGEAKALATNNPALLEKMNLDRKVMNLQILKSSWQSNRVTLNQNVESVYPKQLDSYKKELATTIADNDFVVNELGKDFSVELVGQVIADKKEALAAFNALLPNAADFKEKPLGSYKGFRLSVVPAQFGQLSLILEREGRYPVAIERNGTGTFTRMDNKLKNLPEKINDLKNKEADVEKSLAQGKEQLEKPFAQEEELKELLQKQIDLNLSLEMQEGITSKKQQRKQSAPTVEIPGESKKASHQGTPTFEQSI